MNKLISFSLVFFGFWLFAGSAFSQSSEFAFQGRLTDSGVPVAVNYDLRFRLYSQSAGGTAIGTVERTDVPVSNGVFTVKLDFGAAAFDGAARWIETEVKPSGSGTYQPLNPRVFLTTVPYAVRSLSAGNAGQLGGVAAAEFVQTSDPRMTDARPPTPGNSSYIQNTTTAQTSSNFNISGTGKATILEATSQFTIRGDRVLYKSQVGDSFFAGVGAGGITTVGPGNSFFGTSAGYSTYTGGFNSFFGSGAGAANRVGSFNAFFGYTAGPNSDSDRNSFFGTDSGRGTTTGSKNSFFGHFAGDANVSGSNNTIIGEQADLGAVNLVYATAIGSEAVVTFNNAIQLGRNDIDRVLIGTLGVAGPTAICLNANNTISSCSSSIRYKKNIQDFSSGLDLVKNFRPVSFNWKADNKYDIGLVAEEVAEVEPLLITYNDKGEVEGVKYDRVGVVLVNAVNEQQTQIDTLNKTVVELKREIEELRSLLCSAAPNAASCRQQ